MSLDRPTGLRFAFNWSALAAFDGRDGAIGAMKSRRPTTIAAAPPALDERSISSPIRKIRRPALNSAQGTVPEEALAVEVPGLEAVIVILAARFAR
jgi:hypothetical protein